MSLFHWSRVAVLLALFLAVAAVTYLHLIGLPDYLKRPLLRHLREKGFEAQFSNMHLGWGPVVVIDNVAFSPANQPSGPRLSAGMAQLALNLNALLHWRLEVDSLAVLEGRLQLPLSATNGDTLSLDDVRLEVALLSNNVAQLREGRASFRGIQIRVRGEVSDFLALRHWKFPFRLGRTPPEDYQAHLRRAAEIIRQIHFEGTPRLDLVVGADGGDMNSLRADLAFTAPEASTPWGETSRFKLRAACAHLLTSGNGPFAQVRLEAERVSTRWGAGSNLSCSATLTRDAGTNFNAAIDFAGSGLEAKWESGAGSKYWVHAGNLRWDGEATVPSTNLAPAALAGTLRVAGADSSWGSASSLNLSCQARRAAPAVLADAAWGEWKRIHPYAIEWQAAATDVKAPKLQIEEAAVEGRWQAPEVAVKKLRAKLYRGHLDSQADLDVATREARLHAALDFDPHKVWPLLTPAAQHWISQFEWSDPPRVQGDLRLVLPPWTNRPDGWQADLRSSVALAGDFSVGPASFRGVAFRSAGSHFTYTNRVWNLPRLRATRPDGAVEMDYTGNEATHEYHFAFDSNLDPADIADWLTPAQQRLLGEAKFSTPPEIHAQAWGRWRDRDTLGFSGTVAAGRFAVRGETVEALNASVEYTNHRVRVAGLRLAREGGALTAPLVTADLNSKQIVLTNVESTLDPGLLRRVLGTNTPGFLDRVHFDTPPRVRASGSFAWNNPLATDVRFMIEGEQFHWTNLTAEKISGEVHWLGRHVAVTNVQARLYRTGTLTGWITFDYVPKHGSSFRTDCAVRDIDLSALARGWTGRSNRLEGLLDGRLTLHSPVAADPHALAGHGYVYVHDALLWDIRLFGILSPVLNVIMPGAGNSRAREASATFTVGNGEVSSDDLEVGATGYRLLYWGKAGLDKQIDARVEADLLRETPVLGPLLRMVLTPLSKVFEYHISGSVLNPAIEPVYIPKVLMLFLRPFHTLKSILPEGPAETPETPPATTPKAAR